MTAANQDLSQSRSLAYNNDDEPHSIYHNMDYGSLMLKSLSC